jgi:hypothetical protein
MFSDERTDALDLVEENPGPSPDVLLDSEPLGEDPEDPFSARTALGSEATAFSEAEGSDASELKEGNSVLGPSPEFLSVASFASLLEVSGNTYIMFSFDVTASSNVAPAERSSASELIGANHGCKVTLLDPAGESLGWLLESLANDGDKLGFGAASCGKNGRVADGVEERAPSVLPLLSPSPTPVTTSTATSSSSSSPSAPNVREGNPGRSQSLYWTWNRVDCGIVGTAGCDGPPLSTLNLDGSLAKRNACGTDEFTSSLWGALNIDGSTVCRTAGFTASLWGALNLDGSLAKRNACGTAEFNTSLWGVLNLAASTEWGWPGVHVSFLDA